MRRILCIPALLFLLLSAADAQDVKSENIPNEILSEVVQAQFAGKYELDGSINPFYLRGDFDGDGKPDFAVRVRSKVRSESGIAVWLSAQHKFVVIGAGVPFRVSGTIVTNLDFLDVWQISAKALVERGVETGPSPHPKGDAILTGKSESANGLIYWNGRTLGRCLPKRRSSLHC